MRLLGDDPMIFPRQNSGFTGTERADWEAWLVEDREFGAARERESETALRVRSAGGESESV